MRLGRPGAGARTHTGRLGDTGAATVRDDARGAGRGRRGVAAIAGTQIARADGCRRFRIEHHDLDRLRLGRRGSHHALAMDHDRADRGDHRRVHGDRRDDGASDRHERQTATPVAGLSATVPPP